MPKPPIHGKLLFHQRNPAQTLRLFQRDRQVSNFFGLQMVFGCYGKAGGRHHYSRNCTYVLHECNGRTGYTSINRSVVPLGLDNHNWFRLAGPKDAGVDLPPAFGFSTKQPDVVLDLKLR